jgi:hypothetical protein
MLVRSLLLVVVCVLGCQSKPAAVPPAGPKISLADKLEAAKAIAAEAKAEYQRLENKVAEIEEVMRLGAGTSNEEAKAKAIELYGDRKSRMWDAKHKWEDAEQAVQRLAKQIIQE